MTKQERDAWAAAYRLYDEFAPALRQAAALDDDNAMACGLFSDAFEKLSKVYDAMDAGGRLITTAAYGILENVFKDAKEHAQQPPGRADAAEMGKYSA